jgi:integrase
MSVQKLGEGRYRIWVFLGRDAGGRQKRYSEVFRGTKARAEQRERELRRMLDTNTFVDPRSGTVGEYLERWLRDYCEAAVTERTLHRYRQIVTLHLIPMLGARRLPELTPLDIEEAKRHWLRAGSRRTEGKGLHPRTVKHHLTVLHDALAQAVRWRLLTINPCDAVAPVKVPRTQPQALDTDQAARLVDLLDGHEFERIFRLALAAGMRPGEYTALRWEDVDWKRRRVTVRQGLWQLTRSDVRVVGVKTHRSERPIALVDEEIELLREERRRQAAVRLRAGAAWDDNGLAFTDDRGRPLDQYRLRRSFYALLKAAGLPKVNLYSGPWPASCTRSGCRRRRSRPGWGTRTRRSSSTTTSRSSTRRTARPPRAWRPRSARRSAHAVHTRRVRTDGTAHHRSENPIDPNWRSGAPGRTRTSDTRFRKPLLYPLSYGGGTADPSSRCRPDQPPGAPSEAP